jgi:hypothetical protein
LRPNQNPAFTAGFLLAKTFLPFDYRSGLLTKKNTGQLCIKTFLGVTKLPVLANGKLSQ